MMEVVVDCDASEIRGGEGLRGRSIGREGRADKRDLVDLVGAPGSVRRAFGSAGMGFGKDRRRRRMVSWERQGMKAADKRCRGDEDKRATRAREEPPREFQQRADAEGRGIQFGSWCCWALGYAGLWVRGYR